MKNFNNYILFFIFIFLGSSLFALPFNSKISEQELSDLENGKVLIRNIDYSKHMCLDSDNELAAELKRSIKSLSPKYLAEVIKIKPYKGNENLPEVLEQLLLNVPDYAGIPYWSERNQRYYDLYSSAEITKIETIDNRTVILSDLKMDPFGKVNESIEIIKSDDGILYFSENLNTLNYKGKFDCVGPKKMNMCILLFRYEDNWILYGIGGVNAPRVPFLTARIETSFINRIKTFCNFVFTKIDN